MILVSQLTNQSVKSNDCIEDCPKREAPYVIVLQPALPIYRIDFFERLHRKFGSRFTVYVSRQGELGRLEQANLDHAWLRNLGQRRWLLPGLAWQVGALSIPLTSKTILVVPGEPRTVSTLLLALKARWKGARVVWWGHFWSATSRPWRAAIRIALMKLLSDAVLFYTEQEVLEYQSNSDNTYRPMEIYGLNNGIAIDKIAAYRLPYEPAARERDLLFIGRITAKAKLELLFAALAKPNCKRVTLDIIGDGEAAEPLRALAAALEVEDQITWHGAVTNEARIAVLANRCKVFVYPGGVGLSLLHGLAYGLPAIVHDNRWTHMPEIAAHRPNGNGVTFREGSAESLAQVIASQLADQDQLRKLSFVAKATSAQSFNTADMAERFTNMIESLR